MHKEIYAIAKHYGDDCKNCEEVCCANMELDISREELSFNTLLTELKQPLVEIPSEELKEMKMEKNPYQNANEDVIKRLENVKHLWKSIMHVIGC